MAYGGEMRLSEKQMKFSIMVSKLITFATEQNIGITLGHAWRDVETQQRLYDKGLSRTMNSKHLDKLAIDLNVFVNKRGHLVWSANTEDYEVLGDYWENKLGGRWGGNFNNFVDAGHFEYL